MFFKGVSMQITKIVITGGPCGGKSTAMRWISHVFTKAGYKVLFVPETATELITGGVAPWTCGTNAEYQKCQMKLQMEKENLFEQAGRTMKTDKLLIVCDRGELDNKAYMNEEEFAEVLGFLGATEEELLARYDAVFHLVTAAKDTVRFYTFENNQARYETAEEAVTLDQRLMDCWSGHPYLKVIPGQDDFAMKMRHLMNEIADYLGTTVTVDLDEMIDD